MASFNGLGILLIQVGTPAAPTSEALRVYLRQFLSDPRIIAIAGSWKWRFILNCFILRKRPAESAAKYQRIWHPHTGSPLYFWTCRQAELLQALFPGVLVRFGMQVGEPSVAKVVGEMIAAGTERLLVLPMYPQYSATTTASATDALFKALLQERCVPALRIVPPYYQHPAYLDALVDIIRGELARLPWQPQHFLLSFHGIPVAYAQAGDPYATHVARTARQLANRLNWPRNCWTQTYQSRFGSQPWLKPYTDETLVKLARAGIRRILVAMPGFTTDCLETIDEIGHEAQETFRQAGGEVLHACPCLNAHPRWIQAMQILLAEEGRGWIS